LLGENAADPRVPAAPNVPKVSIRGSDDEFDAAPPVAHSHASELDPESRPAAAARHGAPDSGPEIEIDPASELSPSARRAVLASTGRNPPVSEHIAGSRPANAKKAAPRLWLLLFGLFVAVGIVIARWRELSALFH
jgi:hypothetical protein